MNAGKQPFFFGAMVIAILIGAMIGYFFGFSVGENAGDAEARASITKLQNALDMLVPPLPEVISVVSGKITAVNDNAFTLEILSFADRYPHPDTPPATETRTVKITGDTKIAAMNFDPKTFKDGLPAQTAIKFSELKIGDFVTVTVSENARAEQNLTAAAINRSSGI